MITLQARLTASAAGGGLLLEALLAKNAKVM